MNGRSWAALVMASGLGCASPAVGPIAPPAAAWQPLRLHFEPPLPAPARLAWRHEAGIVGECTTACTGVDLSLPEGPVALMLHTAAGRREWVVRILGGESEVVWQLGRAPDGAAR